MTPHDFVFDAIYKGALKQGANERIAKDCAVIGLQKYKRCQFKKIDQLINQTIKEAVKQSKKA